MALSTDEAGLRALVYGGAVLGGGGGGSLASGLNSLATIHAAGTPRIVPLSALPSDARLVTLSAVGSAGATSDGSVTEEHFRRALEVFQIFSRSRIGGYIASEVGARAVTYGLLESLRSGLPVVDAPANGRAHPLFVMGSLGLHRKLGLATATVAVGGAPGLASYVELALRTNVIKAARIVRQRAAQGGIGLAVVRNPLPVAAVREHAAVGGLAFAQKVGRVLLSSLSGGLQQVTRSLGQLMGGRLLARGYVVSVNLSEAQGFSLGDIQILCEDGTTARIGVCNEYLSLSLRGERAATFPDLIALFDRDSALPLGTAEVKVNRSLGVFVVPRVRLLLGSAMHDTRLLAPIERALGSKLRTAGDPA